MAGEYKEEQMVDSVRVSFIGGERNGQGGVVVHSLDAATGETLADFREATPAEVDAAAQAAARAYPAYRNLPAERRALFLEAIAEEIDALDEAFVATACRETAYPPARIQNERGRTSGQLRLFATVLRRGDYLGARIDRALPDRTPAPRPDLRQYKIGLGPVAVFGASNFPLAFSTAGGDTASALAAGCPVVVKAHPSHMLTSERVADAIERAVRRTDMPAGVFNMIYGGEAGADLVRNPLIQAVGFTGSLRGGRALCDIAAARPSPIPVFAEMSSINPVLLFPGVLERRAKEIAEELFASLSLGSGQFCTNPGLVIAPRGPGLAAFAARLEALVNALPGQTLLNPGVLSHYQSGVAAMERHIGVETLAGPPQGQGKAFGRVFRAEARLFTEGDPVVQAEMFGPATVLVEVDDRAELLSVLGALHGQLTASLIADPEDLADAGEILSLLEQRVGRVLVNGYPTGVEVSDAIVHGGPYPATSDARGTSVGTLAIERWLRPICYQNVPDALLPDALKNANPLGIERLVDGRRTREALT